MLGMIVSHHRVFVNVGSIEVRVWWVVFRVLTRYRICGRWIARGVNRER